MRALRRATRWLPFLLFPFPTSGWADTSTTTVQVTDASAAGSPFLVSGTVELRETTAGRQLRSRADYQVTLRNISSQTILAFSGQLNVVPPHGGPQVFDTNVECFFAPDVIKPGDEESLSSRFPPTTAEPFNPSSPPRTLRAEFTVLFAQFADGSVFGPELLGQQIMERRRITWKHLKDLLRIYDREGEAAFVEELMEPIDPPEVNTFFENLRQTQRQQGTQRTLARIRGALLFAEERKAGFRGRGN